MCRLLFVRSLAPFSIQKHLEKFAYISKNSTEDQSHGWGCSYLDETGKWHHYKNITPQWDDDLAQFGTTTLLIAHARSAFRDEGIVVENNMPFFDEKYVFIFNGQLDKVKIKSDGRIGAEKIFNYIKRFDKGNILEALKKATQIITKRSEYVKAMNIIITDGTSAYVCTQFSERAEYFTLHYKKSGDTLIICSDPYNEEVGWENFPNNTTEVL